MIIGNRNYNEKHTHIMGILNVTPDSFSDGGRYNNKEAALMKFFEEMRSRGIVGTVINTPREAEAGCGLSVRFSPRQKNAVLSILERHGFSSFIGVFEATATDGKRFVRPA